MAGRPYAFGLATALLAEGFYVNEASSVLEPSDERIHSLIARWVKTVRDIGKASTK